MQSLDRSISNIWEQRYGIKCVLRGKRAKILLHLPSQGPMTIRHSSHSSIFTAAKWSSSNMQHSWNHFPHTCYPHSWNNFSLSSTWIFSIKGASASFYYYRYLWHVRTNFTFLDSELFAGNTAIWFDSNFTAKINETIICWIGFFFIPKIFIPI